MIDNITRLANYANRESNEAGRVHQVHKYVIPSHVKRLSIRCSIFAMLLFVKKKEERGKRRVENDD